jgi:acyl-coenzyme A synthetase/AMP-(fatty) acid ligase
MNCVSLFLAQARQNPSKMALWLPEEGVTTFGELKRLASSAQALAISKGIGPGDTVLLLEGLGSRLYAAVIGILGLGATVILVEPWMPVKKINHVIESVKPKLFLSGLFGKLWGARVRSVRKIPHWVTASKINHMKTSADFQIQEVDEGVPGIITFTSGTTGNPKGVVRHQGYLLNQHRVLTETLEGERLSNPDLCIFANFALLNLASGRGTLIVPPKWKKSVLKQIENLPQELLPASLTCGPAFLKNVMKNARLPTLTHIHVGGALTDCDIFENAFDHWPFVRQ